MARRIGIRLLLSLSLLTIVVAPTSVVQAEIAPPWCGTPQPEGVTDVQSLDPNSFPHIPWYAMECTLDRIAGQSNGRMSFEITGQSALGRRPVRRAVFNAQDTPQQRRDYQNWLQVRKIALEDPARAQELLDRFGDNVKVPVMIQSGIHGGESEGVDAMFMIAERLATTPYGTDPRSTRSSTTSSSSGTSTTTRTAGSRTRGPTATASTSTATGSPSPSRRRWRPLPSSASGSPSTCSTSMATSRPRSSRPRRSRTTRASSTTCGSSGTRAASTPTRWRWKPSGWTSPVRSTTGARTATSPARAASAPTAACPVPAVAEGWDDWGPFYTPMYAQHIGLNGSTVEMCNSQGTGCLTSPTSPAPRGRLGSRLAQYTVSWSTLLYNLANRNEILNDELEIYRRGVENAPRPTCPPAFPTDCVWMHEYGKAYVIPLGEGQRSDVEANRLVNWLLTNQIEVHELKSDYTFEGRTFQKGSYVAWLAQARRGLLDTAMGIGVNISASINQLYAPPGAWSHGWLWGADVAFIQRNATFNPQTNRVTKASHLLGGVQPGPADRYALLLNSATSVRTLNALMDEGLTAEIALAARW